MNNNYTDLLVIGGGPAGMMAAIKAADKGLSVSLVEKNEKLGKKLYITGKGRCNISNASSQEDLISNITDNASFMYSSFYSFTNYDLMDFFENEGLSLKIERGGRVFPASDKSSDVIKILERALLNRKVKIFYRHQVEKIVVNKANGVKEISFKNKGAIRAKKVIIATGGRSYPTTGSTGEGYSLAKSLGHTITRTYCGLVPIETKEKDITSLSGLALKNIRLDLLVGGKKRYSDQGELLFTHFGISGPLVLSASNYLEYEKDTSMLKASKIYLDLKPALDMEKLDKRLIRDFDQTKNKDILNAIKKLMPKAFLPILLDRSKIPHDKKVNEISRQERRAIIDNLKKFELTPDKTREYREAIITRGGIKTTEINPATMESKLIEGLYFAGEIIDVVGLTGGYNLQVAFSTGALAGEKAGLSILK